MLPVNGAAARQFTGDLRSRPGIWAIPVSGLRATGEPTLVRPLDGRISRLGIESNGSVHYVHAVGGGNVYLADFDPRTGRVISTPVSLGSRMTGAQRYLAWLPDGRSLLMQGRDGKGRGALFRVDLAGSTITRLCDSSDSPPAVSHDGSSVYVRRETGENESVIVELSLQDGSERVALAESTATFRLSPDYLRWVTLSAPRGPLSIIQGADGASREVSKPEGVRLLLRGDWMPDGRRLLIVGAKQGGMELLAVDLDTGAVREAGARFASIHWASVHPAGTRVAISATEGGGGAEVWVLSGLAGTAR